jgi:hypothetical protein
MADEQTKEIENFSVWGSECLGKTKTYEEAVKLKGNLEKIGWKHVAVFDAARQEVKENPLNK